MTVTISGDTGITTPGITNTGSTTLVNLTTTGNTILGDASTDTLNVGNGNLILDASGNAGLGVTPSAWDSTWRALDVDTRTAIVSAGNKTSIFTNNAYFNSGWKYKASQFAGTYAISTTTGNHEWNTAASGTAGNAITFTQAMTLDASGNLGVGTTSPIGKIDIGTTAGAPTNGLYITYAGTQVASFTSNAGTGEVRIGATNGTGTFFPTFYSNNTERARITSGGNLCVGTTSAYSPVGNAGSSIASFINSITCSDGTNAASFSATASAGIYFNSAYWRIYNTVGAGVYLQNGSTAWTGVSDATLKNVISPITNGLSIVNNLKPTIYSWKSDESNKPYAGLIAQEVQTVLPSIVSNNDGIYGVAYTEIIPYLISAIQELKSENDSLKARLDAANL
jgi:hypothetical protein